MNLQQSRLDDVLVQLAALVRYHCRFEVTRKAAFNSKRRGVHVIKWFRAADESTRLGVGLDPPEPG